MVLVAGSFGLQHFAQLRYTYRRNKLVKEEIDKFKVSKKETSLEEEFEEIGKMDLDNWKNIRGPRPWEDSKAFQDSQRKSS